ncbi:response regulator receiver protein [Magnetococcus marinus MC-1]|uniref:Response regulator receiver protein n=1 Tax=Magnetococcus marinus (strain ATCC BAA-1437 / JCM 17883 / MC-1) TaxID=156889 RepID=A0LA11_MAGMM|nr:response regulator [Magnetococcus marinus]ABK44804.1 response regulator receiver protein [Magnetococcus marinus MC-1]
MNRVDEKQAILVVDDSPANIEIIKGTLVPEFTILATLNGNSAVKIAEAKQPDLILLDIMMPDMDGYEVCRRLKANDQTNRIPIIFTSAKNAIMDEAKGMMLGAVDYLIKPLEPKILKVRVQAQLHQQRQWRIREHQLLARIHELESTQRG